MSSPAPGASSTTLWTSSTVKGNAPPPVPSGQCPTETGEVVKLSLNLAQPSPPYVTATVTVGEHFWVDATQHNEVSQFPAPVPSGTTATLTTVCTRTYTTGGQQHAATYFTATGAGTAMVVSINTCTGCANLSNDAKITITQ